jgi:hypothetical protein
MNKYLLLTFALFTTIPGCKGADPPCPPCETIAFKITMYDSLGINKINGFNIQARHENNNFIRAIDTNWAIDSCYFIFGQGGSYDLQIVGPVCYIELTDLVVEQGRCYPNTRILNITTNNNILKDSTSIGCGN